MTPAALFPWMLMLLLQLEESRSHTPFRQFGGHIVPHEHRLFSGSSTPVPWRYRLSGGSQSEDTTASSVARGGSTRTASFAPDDEEDDSTRVRRSPLQSEEEDKEDDFSPADNVHTSPRRVKELEGYMHMNAEVRDDGPMSTDPVSSRNSSSQLEVFPDDSPKETPTISKRKKLHLPFIKKKDDSHKRHKQIAKTLKNRNSVNLRRKVLHAAFGLTFALLNNIIPRQRFVPGMAILSTATLIMELLRYRKGFGWMNDALHFVLGSSLRKHEMDGKFTGSFYFFTGVTLTAYLYPGTAATLGIAQLALADPSASYFGRQTRHVYWSRIENGLGGIGRNKGWLGFLGGALFCVPFNYCVLRRAMMEHTAQIWGAKAIMSVSLLLGLAGALADLAVPTPALVLPKKILGVRVPPFHVDDNMVVPIFSAFACTKVFELYGWPQDLALTKWMIL